MNRAALTLMMKPNGNGKKDCLSNPLNSDALIERVSSKQLLNQQQQQQQQQQQHSNHAY